MLILPVAIAKILKEYFIYPGYMKYYQVWFQYDSIRVS